MEKKEIFLKVVSVLVRHGVKKIAIFGLSLKNEIKNLIEKEQSYARKEKRKNPYNKGLLR